MSEALIIAVVSALVELVKGLEGAPSQAQIEATVRASMIQASDLAMSQEFPGEPG